MDDVCDTCFVPANTPQVQHPIWCAGMKEMKRRVEEISKKYEELKADHEKLRREHSDLAKNAQPAISASVVYGGRR
jgi:hypothetical protein